MAKSEFLVVGAKEARAKLKKAGDDLSEMKQLHLEIAQAVADAARPKAPVGSPSRGDPHPGRLKKSVRASGTKTAATVRMGSKRVPYANAIHWGRRMWPALGVIPKSGRRPFRAPIPSRPFIFNTAHAMEPAIRAKYERFIKTVLEG